MKLVIDFPGLPPDQVKDVAEVLDDAGFDAVIAGQVNPVLDGGVNPYAPVPVVVPLEA